MPITREEFELGMSTEIAERTRAIYVQLRRNPELAFTAEELSHSINVVLDGALMVALSGLIERGAAETGWVAGTMYYTLGPKPLEL